MVNLNLNKIGKPIRLLLATALVASSSISGAYAQEDLKTDTDQIISQLTALKRGGGVGSQSAVNMQQLKATAERRKARMLKLMKDNPELFLKNAIPKKTRQELEAPAEIDQFLETYMTEDGVMPMRGRFRKKSDLRELEVHSAMGDISLFHGQEIGIEAVKLDDQMVVESIQAPRARSGEGRPGIKIMRMSGRVRPHTVTPSHVGGFSPSQVRHAYSLDSSPNTGAGQIIALTGAFAYANAAADIKKFSEEFGITVPNGVPGKPACTVAAGPHPCFEVKASGISPSTVVSIWEMEQALDTQWAHAIAPDADILLMQAESNGLTQLLGAVDKSQQAGARVVSNSWGASEFSFQSLYDAVLNKPGVVFLASSGDSGHAAQWPASSPAVLAVGGTNLAVDGNGNRTSETAHASSGGGISTYSPLPSSQSGYPIPASNGKRGVPDVAALYTAFPISVNGNWTIVGGTSGSAPVWAGIVALANQTRSTPLTGNTDIYAAAKANPSAFFDITAGSNGSCGTECNAGPGYDFVNGLGAPGPDIMTTLTGKSAPSNSAPTVAVDISATPAVVTGVSTNLSVLGADNNGEAALTYSWSFVGSQGVTFSASGTNAAKNTTVTFPRAGNYGCTVTIRDAQGLTVTQTASVQVLPTFTAVSVTPVSASVAVNGTRQFTAGAKDQFENFMTLSTPWSFTVSGGGTLDSNFLFTAGASIGGPFTVSATNAGKSGTAEVTVTTQSNTPTAGIPPGLRNVFNPAKGEKAAIDCDAGNVDIYTTKRELVVSLNCADGQAVWSGEGSAAGVYFAVSNSRKNKIVLIK